MVRLVFDDLERVKAARPPGYIDALIQVATRDGDAYLLQDADWQSISKRYAQPILIQEDPPQEPSLAQMAANFAGSMVGWIKAGFPVVSEAQFRARQTACNGCAEWDAQARFGMGKCRACGCTKWKPWLATATCKRGRWTT